MISLQVIQLHATKELCRNFMRVVFPYAYLVNPQAREQAREQVREQVTSVVLKIKNEMSVVEIMASLELKGRRNFLQNYLQPALASGFIEMTQPESPKSPTQKYRLTARGKTLAGKGVDHD